MTEHAPTTVGATLGRLRKMLGHLRARDRDTVLEAIDAIYELSVRLHEATHGPTLPPSRLPPISPAAGIPPAAEGSVD